MPGPGLLQDKVTAIIKRSVRSMSMLLGVLWACAIAVRTLEAGLEHGISMPLELVREVSWATRDTPTRFSTSDVTA